MITVADLLPRRRVPPPEPPEGPQAGDLDRLMPREHDVTVFGDWHPPGTAGFVPVWTDDGGGT